MNMTNTNLYNIEGRYLDNSLIEHFHRSLIEDERSDATIEKYLRDLRAFQRFAGHQVICKQLVIQYKQYLIENYAPASVNSILAAINRFFKEMEWYDCIVKPLRIQRQAFRVNERELTKEEYFRLLHAAYERQNHRLYYLLQTVCSTGIRISELSFITVEAVRAGEATVSLKGKTRQVLLPISLCAELMCYAETHNIQAGPIFISSKGNPLDRNNILHDMKSLCAAAKVERGKVFPHNLRHLFASEYYSAEKDISHLADILGHSSIDTTRIYTSTSSKKHYEQIEKLGLVIKRKSNVSQQSEYRPFCA